MAKKMAPKSANEIKVKINQSEPIEVKKPENKKAPVEKTEAKTPAKKSAPKKSVAKKDSEPEAKKTVALKINEQFNGINLFFADGKAGADPHRAFMNDEMKMHFHNTDKYWFVKLRNREQIDTIIAHFGDRLDIPEGLDEQVATILASLEAGKSVATKAASKSKAVKTAAPKSNLKKEEYQAYFMSVGKEKLARAYDFLMAEGAGLMMSTDTGKVITSEGIPF